MPDTAVVDFKLYRDGGENTINHLRLTLDEVADHGEDGFTLSAVSDTFDEDGTLLASTGPAEFRIGKDEPLWSIIPRGMKASEGIDS